jgi:hypothetical protein
MKIYFVLLLSEPGMGDNLRKPRECLCAIGMVTISDNSLNVNVKI